LRVRSLMLVLFIAALLPVFGGCDTGTTQDDESCPSFADMQLLPETGDAGTEFVLWIKLKDSQANREIDSMIAQLYLVDGRPNNKTFDLVRVENDPYKYIRTFNGDEVCETGTCTLFFRVVATHKDGCQKSFDTPLFQVVIDQGADDDTQ
jgi:hypothetical protein